MNVPGVRPKDIFVYSSRPCPEGCFLDIRLGQDYRNIQLLSEHLTFLRFNAAGSHPCETFFRARTIGEGYGLDDSLMIPE